MSKKGLYAMAAMAAVGLFVLLNFRQLRPKVTRIAASDTHSFHGENEVIMVQQKNVNNSLKGNSSYNEEVGASHKSESKGSTTKSRKDPAEMTKEMKEMKEMQKIIEEKNEKAEKMEKERKAAAEKLEKDKIKLMEKDALLQKEKKVQEKSRQLFERQKMELEEQKIWLKEEMKRFEDYKKTALNRTAKKTGDPYKPDKVVDAESARLALKSLQSQTKGLFLGLDPVEIHNRWPGLMLDGNYVLREFVDSSDPRARGMENKPKNIEDMTDTGAEDRFYQLVTTNHLHCADKRRMGNYGDGGWDICVSGPYEPQDGCLVYSFGINNDFSFDDAMGQVYGCQVKAYDPSMKQGDHKRSDHVFFYKIGLGSADSTNGQGWKLMGLQSILRQNRHRDKTIDYLKIDIEYNEWAALEVILERQILKNVKQFAIEIHTSEVMSKVTSKFDFLRFYSTLLGLEKQGFRRYHYHFNPYGRYTSKRSGKERTCCYEIYYINIHYLKDS